MLPPVHTCKNMTKSESPVSAFGVWKRTPLGTRRCNDCRPVSSRYEKGVTWGRVLGSGWWEKDKDTGRAKACARLSNILCLTQNLHSHTVSSHFWPSLRLTRKGSIRRSDVGNWREVSRTGHKIRNTHPPRKKGAE